MTVEEMGTARVSRLGSWYYGKGQETLGDKVVFQQLEAPYLRMYELACKAVKTHNDGKTQQAEEVLVDLTAASQEVIAILEQLREIVIEDKKKYH